MLIIWAFLLNQLENAWKWFHQYIPIDKPHRGNCIRQQYGCLSSFMNLQETIQESVGLTFRVWFVYHTDNGYPRVLYTLQTKRELLKKKYRQFHNFSQGRTGYFVQLKLNQPPMCSKMCCMHVSRNMPETLIDVESVSRALPKISGPHLGTCQK